MGLRGPKPLPAKVIALRGASHLARDGYSGGLEPLIELPGIPRHLLPEARKEWKRIGAELMRYGLVSKLDRGALALYCQAWAWMVYHEEQLQREMKLAAARRDAHEAAEAAILAEYEARGEQYTPKPWTGGDGFMIPGGNGGFSYSPHWVAKNKAAEQVDKFLASFGLSPSARSKVTPSSNQGELFGGEPDAKNDTRATEGFNAL